MSDRDQSESLQHEVDEFLRSARAQWVGVQVEFDGAQSSAPDVERLSLGAPDSEVRRAADAVLERAVVSSGQPFVDAVQVLRAGVRSAGYRDRLAASTAATQWDGDAVVSAGRQYLRETEARYRTLVSELPVRPRTVADLLQAAARAARPVPEQPVDEVVRSLRLDHEWPLSGVRYEVNEEAGSRGGAYCEPLDAPEDVVVVTGRIDSGERLRDLLHESAHAAHFRSMHPALTDEQKYDGDQGLVEAWGVAYERFVAFDEVGRLVPPQQAGREIVDLLDLVLMRVQFARMLFAVAVDAEDVRTTEDIVAVHRRVVGDTVGVVPAPTAWIQDLGWDLPGATRVRSWLMGAQLSEFVGREVWELGAGEHWRRQGTRWAVGQPAHGEGWLAEELSIETGAEALIHLHRGLERG